jgi:hypothetical protein
MPRALAGKTRQAQKETTVYSIQQDRQGQKIILDGDFLDQNIGEVMGFQSTGLADELSIANAVADIEADNDQLQAALAEMPWTIEEACAFLQENAGGYSFGLSEFNTAYIGFRKVVIRVHKMGASSASNGALHTFEGTAWRDTCYSCLSALFPNPQAA